MLEINTVTNGPTSKCVECVCHATLPWLISLSLGVMSLDQAKSFESLRHAIKRGDTLAIAHYLESGGDSNLSSSHRSTLLMLAAQEGQSSIVDLLLQHGADINAQDVRGYTAVSLAAFRGHTRVVEHLLACGARVVDQVAGASLIGLLRHYGAARERVIDVLQRAAALQTNET
jgi:hypothetical protein